MSALGWVDFDPKDTERAREILNLFASPEARDELGLGVVRDGFADLLFPGTSTIQTRLRYFIILPFLTVEAVKSKKPSQDAAEALRLVEEAFILRCREAGDVIGLIGREAGVAVKRMPSSVYWNGLLQWGIRRNGLQNIPLTLERMAAGDACWDMPPRHEDLASFRLSEEEKLFLVDKVSALRNADGQTVLGWMFANIKDLSSRLESIQNFWDLEPLLREADAPDELVHKVTCASRFSAIMHGAALLYNLMIAENLKKGPPDVPDYGEALAEWQEIRGEPVTPDALLAPLQDLISWKALNPKTKAFIDAWFEVAWDNPTQDKARTIVQQREASVKGKKARLNKDPENLNWSGASGANRLDYRWPTVRQFLADLRA